MNKGGKGYFVNLLGLKFGLLIIIKRGPNYRGKCRWIAKCVCGKEKLIRSISLTSGVTKSCGATNHKSRTKTGRFTNII